MNAENKQNFTWLNKQGVRSERGFEVQTLSRLKQEYREGDRKISIYCEPGKAPDGRWCRIIAADAFKHWDDDPPFVTISEERQQEILEKFTAAMEFQGLAVIIDEHRLDHE